MTLFALARPMRLCLWGFPQLFTASYPVKTTVQCLMPRGFHYYSPRQMTNQRGFDLFKDIDTLERDQHALKQDQHALKQDQHDLRKSMHSLKEGLDRMEREAMYDRAFRFMNHYEQPQNLSIYLADLKSDLEAIEWARDNRNKDILQAAIIGFESKYGLFWSECDTFIHTAPKEIIQIVNKRSDLHHLHHYVCSSHHKMEIEDMKKLCTEIIDMWKDQDLLQGTVSPSDEIMAKVFELDRLHGIWNEHQTKLFTRSSKTKKSP